MIDLVCIRAFGTYVPGDSAGSVPDDAQYSRDFFAPADAAPDAGQAKAVVLAKLEAEHAGDARAAHIAALEAELAALEEETQ